MGTFTTETDMKYVRSETYKVTAIIFIVCSFLASLGFLIAWQTFVFIEAIVMISCFAVLISADRKNHSYEINIEGVTINILDRNDNKSYKLTDIYIEDFIINQSKKEVALDYCSVAIIGTSFTMGGVKNYSALVRYIEENFREKD
ncbi:MAG: hypothetical protein IJF69_02310 [Clostridia bacterium]|nr:hypothetical protein [Clostridia bacterium]